MFKIISSKENFSEWYNSIVQNANLAEQSAVHGCMIIKPYGFAIWEKIKNTFDKKFKETGHQNAYFPALIPKSYFCREAQHVDGFAKECAVVTHHRLKVNEENKIVVDEDARLQDELILRPTSETIIWNTYKNWIQSYRDLPLKINQWCNVFRWEMKTKPFLRTTEFLWQEGHTAHATREEALEEARLMHEIYYDTITDFLAIPLIKGTKTAYERFAGADETFTIEALMQDGKAIQMGTSHLLGQRFAKAFDVKFSNAEGKLEYVWGSSWGVSTRLIGAMIMTHSDDKGLVLPPKIAPIQVVIIPIYKTDKEKNVVLNYLADIIASFDQQNIIFKIDDRESFTPGWKFNEYEMQGVPLRLAVGINDVKNSSVELTRRDNFEKFFVEKGRCMEVVLQTLEDIQKNLYERALKFQKEHTVFVDSYDEFKEAMKSRKGFILAHWDGTTETELKIKEETQATIRCMPRNLGDQEDGRCIRTGEFSKRRVLLAQAY
ncbi:MAG: proline--tRNA ligase [Cytophagales bacterium]|nr:proline--tRNA ligase [Cytophagales bacterium]